MLDNATLIDFCAVFAGYGQWQAPVWFIGIEEAGGRMELDVANRLAMWHSRGRKVLEDVPAFCTALGNHGWHGDQAEPQSTWSQLIRMLLLAQGKSDSAHSLLEYQRHRLGTMQGETCLLELFPLPSPSRDTWNYPAWSALPWLQSRQTYEQHILGTRIQLLRERVDQFRPGVVVFYGDGQLKHWRQIMGNGLYPRPIRNMLISHERDGIAFFVTIHPTNPSLRPHTDTYFQEIGRYFRTHYSKRFRTQE